MFVDAQQFLERLHDEDQCDKSREALLREASDVADQGAHIESDHHDQNEADPQADPTTHRQVRHPVLSGDR